MQVGRLLATALGSALLGGGAVYGATLQPSNADLLADKQKILDENIELHSRLNELSVWDTSVASGEEMSTAFVNTANKYAVSTDDLKAAGGNVYEAIKTKLAAENKLCKP